VVDKVFFIEGKQQEIFVVGFRPAIMERAAEMGLKSEAMDLPDEKNPKVQVLVSGSHHIITAFYNEIKNKDIRIMPFAKNESEKIQYTVTNIKEYNGPNIDWSGYQSSLMTEREMSKNKRIRLSKVSVQEIGRKIIEDNQEVFDRLAKE
jgi:acylphosphatase